MLWFWLLPLSLLCAFWLLWRFRRPHQAPQDVLNTSREGLFLSSHDNSFDALPVRTLSNLQASSSMHDTPTPVFDFSFEDLLASHTILDDDSHLSEEEGSTPPLLIAIEAACEERFPLHYHCGALFLDAVPHRHYQFGDFDATLYSDIINIPEHTAYRHVLSVQKDDISVMTIAAEEDEFQDDPLLQQALYLTPSLSQQSCALSHLVMYTQGNRVNFGLDSDWNDLDRFAQEALRLAQQHLYQEHTTIQTEHEPPLYSVDFASFQGHERDELIFCLEEFLLFELLTFLDLGEELQSQLKSTVHTRFRIQSYLKAIHERKRLPLELGLMLLDDLRQLDTYLQVQQDQDYQSYQRLLDAFGNEDPLTLHTDDIEWHGLSAEARLHQRAKLGDPPRFRERLAPLLLRVQQHVSPSITIHGEFHV